MKSIHEKIWQFSRPYLDTRHNAVHTEIALQFAFQLLKGEGGDEDIVIPAIILHDVGWKMIPVELHLKAFGPGATHPELNRSHEMKGVNIAKSILKKAEFKTDKTNQILEIIDGHDSREEAISLNDMIVKDADKLWRYSKSGFYIDVERFGESINEGLDRLRSNLAKWFFTVTASKIATDKLGRRVKENE
jgi:HD superfamily phosphodiesterase